MDFLNYTRPVWLSGILLIVVYYIVKYMWGLAEELGKYLED